MAEKSAFISVTDKKGATHAVAPDQVAAVCHVPTKGVQLYLKNSTQAIEIADDEAARDLVTSLGIELPDATPAKAPVAKADTLPAARAR